MEVENPDGHFDITAAPEKYAVMLKVLGKKALRISVARIVQEALFLEKRHFCSVH